MFAYKRIINENGLMKTPNNSIGANTIRINFGTWHPENMTPIVFISCKIVIKNVITANANVMVKLPVTFIPKGINPKIFKNNKEKEYNK
jgi:hypothetical protein